MSQRLNEMNWIWSLLVLYSGPVLRSVSCGALPNPSNKPTAVIESQAKFFQDFFSVQLSPYKIEFGHVCEDPDTWEQRYEKKDYKNHRDMGKVRWGDKKGGYGEHYWDLNHAGHNNQHDDGNYQPDGYHHDHDSYDEPSEQSTQYEGDKQEDVTNYADNEHEKKANTQKINEDLEEQRKQDITPETYAQNIGIQPLKIQKRQSQDQNSEREKNDIVLIVNQKERESKQENSRRPQQFVPYERGSVLRGDQNVHILTPAAPPKLFFEPSTGHVIDRTTGQAYLLHPINVNN